MTTLFVVGYIVVGLALWPVIARAIVRWIETTVDYPEVVFVALIIAWFWLLVVPLAVVVTFGYYLFQHWLPWLFFPEVRNMR